MDSAAAAWTLITRLGEAQILLPAMAAAVLWLARTPRTRPLAATWLLATCAAAALTTATKVAFMGWGVGHAGLDFTGLSGHAMFAAAVLPVLARIAAGRAPRPWPRLAIVAGVLLAALIAASRVPVHAHSASEVLLGFTLGLAASAWALRRAQAPETPTPRWMAAALAAWLLVLPLGAPPSRTHDWVTALALEASGRAAPYTRGDLHRQARQAAGAGGGSRPLPVAVQAPAREVQAQPVVQRQIAGHRIR